MAGFTILPIARAEAGSALGVWTRDDGAARMRVAECGDSLCGSLIWLKTPRPDFYNPDSRRRNDSLVGRRILSNMQPTGRDGEWQGEGYNFEDGRSYTNTMTVEGGRLAVQGCAVKTLVCAGTSWRNDR